MQLFKSFFTKTLVLGCISLATQQIKAQAQSIIRGSVLDTTDRKILVNATVNLLRAKDSVLISSVRTNKEGQFQLQHNKEGQYMLMVSYPQYADYLDRLNLELNKDLDLKKIFLNTKEYLLKEVILKSTVSAIRIKGDTTEFRADSFRVTPNADVQELLKKMPGIQVNSKGEITAQGEKVNKVLVDGEEFFSDDPAVVTKSLRADAVDKVQVFDKKSDQATFTGIEDGQKNKTINLQLKEDKKNGYFGKAEIGSNFGQFGNAKLMANAFKGKKKLAGFVTSDNTRFEALNWDESRNYGDGGNMTTEIGEDGGVSMYFNGGGDYDEQNGLPNQLSIGGLFSNKWDKVSTNNSIQYQNLLINGKGSAYTKTILADSSIINNNTSEQRIDKKKYKYNTTNEWGTDSTGLFKVIFKVADVLKDASADYAGQTTNETGRKINQSFRTTGLNEDDKTIAANLSYRKKFAKKGRTISVLTDLNFNDKKQDGSLLSDNSFYDYFGNNIRTEKVDQLKTSQQNTSSINANIVYTEPLDKKAKAFLLFKYGVAVGKNDALRETYDRQKLSNYSANAGLVDSLSNHFVFNNQSHTGSLNFRYVEKKYNFIIGSGFGTAQYQLDNIENNTKRNIQFNNFIPAFSIGFNPKQQRRLKIDYSGKTINPTLQQIQPIIDNTDPLNVNIGNANLKQGFTNRVNISANDFKVLKNKYLGINASFSNTDNAISTSSVIDAFGKTTQQSINVQGSYNMNGSVWYGLDIYKGLNLGINLGPNKSRFVNFVNNIRNVNDNKSMSYGLNFNYWGENAINFYTQFSASNNQTVSSIRPNASTNYWTYNAYGNIDIKLKKIKTYFSINIESRMFQKSIVFPNQRDVHIISPSVRKTFTKTDNWEMKLYAFDIFNQNSNIERNISSNFISENINNGIKRYFLFSVIYNFNKNGKPANMGW
ncbi:MAG: hypothetical protein RL387_64 [Bacteroidota bacterium]|jgi:hypothetical protein